MANTVSPVTVPTNNIGATLANPRQEFWVREDPSDELFGPMSFTHADYYARTLSKMEDRSGLAELCTYLGGRAGDPNVTPTLFVKYLYIRGKRSFGGRVAEYNSGKDLT